MRIKLLFVVLSVCLTAAATSQHEVFNNDTPFYRVSLNGVNGLISTRLRWPIQPPLRA